MIWLIYQYATNSQSIDIYSQLLNETHIDIYESEHRKSVNNKY